LKPFPVQTKRTTPNDLISRFHLLPYSKRADRAERRILRVRWSLSVAARGRLRMDRFMHACSRRRLLAGATASRAYLVPEAPMALVGEEFR
jgi:hypothetical protein